MAWSIAGYGPCSLQWPNLGNPLFSEPTLLRDTTLSLGTTLTRIEPHRLEALVIEDLHRYPGSAISEIHDRVAPEIKRRRLKTALDHLVEEGKVRPEGEKRWRRYWIEVQ